MTQVTSPYDSPFYKGQTPSSLHAAMRILPTVFAVTQPSSVVDVGCGTGTWLAVAKQLGASNVLGIEGKWVDRTDMIDDGIVLRTHNLEQPFLLNDEFDLAMSLEVAEHLTEKRAESFIDDLCRLSKCVLFSAAVPGQGGTNHINEQWQDYWISKFDKRGYRDLDIIRGTHWNDSAIMVHYRQNAILFVHSSVFEKHAPAAMPYLGTQPWRGRIVHPDLYLKKVEEITVLPSLPQALRLVALLPFCIWNSVRVRIR